MILNLFSWIFKFSYNKKFSIIKFEKKIKMGCECSAPIDKKDFLNQQRSFKDIART